MALITGAIYGDPTYGDPTGERYVKALWFESISSGTSGTLTPPTQGTIVLDQWSAGVDALASKISSGIPSFESPLTAGGVVITATLDALGAWTLSGTPSAYPVAIVYCYQVRLKDFDYTKQLGGYELIPTAAGVYTDVTAFNSWLSSSDSTVQKALDTIDNRANQDLLTTSSPSFVTAKLTGLSDGKIPYHVDDATGLADGPTKIDVDDAVTKKHAIGGDTTLGAMTADINMNTHQVTALSVPDAAGEAIRQTAKITEAALEDAVDKKHVAVTVSAPISLSTQAISLINNAVSPATVTAIDIDGTLAGNSDTVLATQKATKTYADTKVSAASNLTDHALVRGDGGAKGVQTSTVLVDDSGRMTNPSQPAFLAIITSSLTNVTGDGTSYNITGAVWTEIFDQSNNLSDGTFTAPITGRYSFGGAIYLDGILSTHTFGYLLLYTSNRYHYCFALSPYAIQGTAAFAYSFATPPVDMEANDTAYLITRVYNGTKVVDIIDAVTTFGGKLVC